MVCARRSIGSRASPGDRRATSGTANSPPPAASPPSTSRAIAAARWARPQTGRSRLCFLDLDGVLDWGLLGFPTPLAGGVQALQLLRHNRFSVVLNTARSLEHVREYCRAYKLPGGVAELGSVFWDAVREWEVPLIDAEAVTQMDALRDRNRSLPGAFIDPENRYSIRAYRFENGSMRPVANR